MSSSVEVTIGDPRAASVAIEVFGRKHPGVSDYDDANWLNARVRLTVPGFQAGYDASLRSDDFALLRETLRVVRRREASPNAWAPLEPWIELEFLNDGDMTLVRGTATNQLGVGSRLSFEMPLSDENIERALGQTEILLGAFPVPPR